MSEKLPISLDDVRDAARVLEGQVERTPLRKSRTLSEITGAEIPKNVHYHLTASPQFMSLSESEAGTS